MYIKDFMNEKKKNDKQKGKHGEERTAMAKKELILFFFSALNVVRENNFY